MESKRPLTHLSLFSGIGGLDLAAELAGFRTAGQCEWADYPIKVLEKYWPDVPRWRDIRTMTRESFYERTGLRTVDVISGGFPCQPFSTAGKRRGKDDDRYLWPEMLRVVEEIRPAWVVGENVAGIVTMALDTALSNLEGIGYTARAFIIPACAVNAPHRRDRCAIVAYSDCKRCEKLQPAAVTVQQETVDKPGYERNVPNAYDWSWSLRRDGELQPVESLEGIRADHGGRTPEYISGKWWEVEPDVGRVVDGVPHRVDRLRCLGNAVVPQQFYPVFKAIYDIEVMQDC